MTPARARRHLHLVDPDAPTPPAEQPQPRQTARPPKHEQELAGLRSRTRASLDGFDIAEIETLATAVRAQLDATEPVEPSTVAALRTALAAYSDVLDWLTTHDRCAYHGELR